MKIFLITGNRYFYLLFCASLALNWFFHKDAERFNDRFELWSDRAGYYIYLPATFFYHFDARSMPADLDISTGGGFSLDTVHNKVDTKYTCGVALLASPFFLASGLVSRIAGYDAESGFSMIYMRMMGLAAVVYLMLGLWLLRKFLDRRFPAAVSLTVVTLVFLGANLFYYSLIDGMMSHVYSFFLFSVFLYALQEYLLSGNYRHFILLSLALSLAILIRPTSIILGLLVFTWDAGSLAGCRKRIIHFLRPSHSLVFLSILLLVFLPQLIYWKYLTGSWIHFSYAGEGFTNWRHPRIAEVLFSPVNGLFAYTPLALLMLAGIILMIARGKRNGWPVAAVFAVVTLAFASWKMWYFGCSYGQRSFVEYYAVLALPLAWLFDGLFKNRSFALKTILLFVVFFMVYANLRYTIVLYRFDRCAYGSTWDWDHYLRSFERAGVISPVRRTGTFKNDFENLAIFPGRRPSARFTRSGQYSFRCGGKEDGVPLWSSMLRDFKYPWPKIMEAELWVLAPGRRPGLAVLVCECSMGGKTLFSDSALAAMEPMKWTRLGKTFLIPDVNDSSLTITLRVADPGRALLFADDLSLRFRYGWSGE